MVLRTSKTQRPSEVGQTGGGGDVRRGNPSRLGVASFHKDPFTKHFIKILHPLKHHKIVPWFSREANKQQNSRGISMHVKSQPCEISYSKGAVRISYCQLKTGLATAHGMEGYFYTSSSSRPQVKCMCMSVGMYDCTVLKESWQELGTEMRHACMHNQDRPYPTCDHDLIPFSSQGS